MFFHNRGSLRACDRKIMAEVFKLRWQVQDEEMMREDCVSNSPPEVDRARSDSRSASSHRRAAEEEEGAAHPLVPLRQLMVTYRTSRAYS